MANLVSYALVAFARENGKMKVVPRRKYVNSQTGEEFESSCCAFEHPTKKDPKQPERALLTFVWFSKNLGQLSAKEIAEKQKELQIIKSSKTDAWILCSVGADAWEEVPLDLG